MPQQLYSLQMFSLCVEDSNHCVVQAGKAFLKRGIFRSFLPSKKNRNWSAGVLPKRFYYTNKI